MKVVRARGRKASVTLNRSDTVTDQKLHSLHTSIKMIPASRYEIVMSDRSAILTKRSLAWYTPALVRP